jgi:trans-aconitate methyltransferase
MQKNVYYEKFCKGNQGFDQFLERVRFNNVRKTVELHKHEHILDIGSGPHSSFLQLQGWETYTIVEPIEEFCDILVNSSLGMKGVIIINRTFEDVVLERKYDCVILSSVLHMIKDDFAVLDKIHYLCDERNIVHINVPNRYSMHRILGVNMGMLSDVSSLSKKDIKYGHKRIYNNADLLGLVSSAGFDVRFYKTYMMKPFNEEKMSCIADERVLSGLEKMIDWFPENGCEIMLEAKAIK